MTDKNFVIVVEHDLSVLDYLSDFICCLYGKPGAYGVVTMPFSVRDGINIFLAGFVPTENLRFREEALSFKVRLLPMACILSIRVHSPCFLLSIRLPEYAPPALRSCSGSSLGHVAVSNIAYDLFDACWMH